MKGTVMLCMKVQYDVQTWCNSDLHWLLLSKLSVCFSPVACPCVSGVNGYPHLTPGSPLTPQPSVGSACISGSAGSDSGCTQDGARYFSVVWCKASKKKHKRWEGDAVLVTRGRTATLKDMEGKDIGKGQLFFITVILKSGRRRTTAVLDHQKNL